MLEIVIFELLDGLLLYYGRKTYCNELDPCDRAMTSRKDGGESTRPGNQRDKDLCLASFRERVFDGGTHSLAHFHFNVSFLGFPAE